MPEQFTSSDLPPPDRDRLEPELNSKSESANPLARTHVEHQRQQVLTEPADPTNYDQFKSLVRSKDGYVDFFAFLRQYHNLHRHHQDSPEWGKSLPQDIAELRTGSNCGYIPMDLLADHYARRFNRQSFFITDHSRDGNAEASAENVKNIFVDQYLNTEVGQSYLQEQFGHQQDLSEAEFLQVQTWAKDAADKLIKYNDERLQKNNQVVAELQQLYGDKVKIYTGIEANLVPDQHGQPTFDSQMVTDGQFVPTIASVHPDVAAQSFAKIVADPHVYSSFLAQAAAMPQVNIIAHPGFGCVLPEDQIAIHNRISDPTLSSDQRELLRKELELQAENPYREQINWAELAQACIDNQVALELNLKVLSDYMYKHVLNLEKYPQGSEQWREDFWAKIPSLIPIINSDNIKQQLKPFIAHGLKLTINLDEHQNPFIGQDFQGSHQTPNHLPLSSHGQEAKKWRFWRAMQIVGDYCNYHLLDMGVRPDSIINTYSASQLQNFFDKTIEKTA